LILHNANEVGRCNHGPGLKDDTQCENGKPERARARKRKRTRERNRKAKREREEDRQREKELGRGSNEARPQS